MSTPAEHGTAVDAILAKNPDVLRASDWLEAEARATLATTTGTGTEYTTADGLITQAATREDRYALLRVAKIHAMLATR